MLERVIVNYDRVQTPKKQVYTETLLLSTKTPVILYIIIRFNSVLYILWKLQTWATLFLQITLQFYIIRNKQTNFPHNTTMRNYMNVAGSWCCFSPSYTSHVHAFIWFTHISTINHRINVQQRTRMFVQLSMVWITYRHILNNINVSSHN